MDHLAQVRRRASAVWLSVTAIVVGGGWVATEPAAALLTSPGPDFPVLLEQGCAVAALLSGSWLWLVTTDVVVGVARGAHPIGARRSVGPLRGALLVACGVAALSSTTAAASGQEGPTSPPLPARVLDGLPLPDRASAAAAGPAPTPGAAEHATAAPVVRVRRGDSLWTIAATRLAPDADVADVASYCHRIYALNSALIGADPDLVLPGQQLRLPPV